MPIPKAFSDTATIDATRPPFDTLPGEIKLLIINYINDDTYTLLNLLLVSKAWNAVLMRGESADNAWEGRFRTISNRKSFKKRKTWHSRYVKLLHGRCIVCFMKIESGGDKAEESVGLLLLRGFKWIKVCLNCQSKPGPMRITTALTLARKYNLTYEELENVPRCSRSCKRYNDNWPPTLYQAHREACDRKVCMLDAAVAQLKLDLLKKEASIIALCPFEKSIFTSALSHSRANHCPSSRVLNEALAEILLCDNPTKEQYEAVKRYYTGLQRILYQLPTVIEETDEYDDQEDKILRFLLGKRSGGYTWLDALLKDQITLKDFSEGFDVSEEESETYWPPGRLRLVPEGDFFRSGYSIHVVDDVDADYDFYERKHLDEEDEGESQRIFKVDLPYHDLLHANLTSAIAGERLRSQMSNYLGCPCVDEQKVEYVSAANKSMILLVDGTFYHCGLQWECLPLKKPFDFLREEWQ